MAAQFLSFVVPWSRVASFPLVFLASPLVRKVV